MVLRDSCKEAVIITHHVFYFHATSLVRIFLIDKLSEGKRATERIYGDEIKAETIRIFLVFLVFEAHLRKHRFQTESLFCSSASLL